MTQYESKKKVTSEEVEEASEAMERVEMPEPTPERPVREKKKPPL